jgi:tetratricopeptide (TPR) repeat protein
MNEAKHSLFRVLRLDPTHPFARDLLEELQKKEVSVLISMSDVREQTALRAKAQEPIEDPEEVLRKLDEDWALGVLESRGPGLSLWTNHEHLKALEQVLLKQVSGSSLRERTDLAVGFLQMEMPSIAVAVLAPVKSEQLRAATLYAAALLQNGNAYECLAELEVALRDLELEPDLRREVLYLMARAREVLKQHDEAAVLYAEIVDYRDASFRLARLRPGTGGVR